MFKHYGSFQLYDDLKIWNKIEYKGTFLALNRLFVVI